MIFCKRGSFATRAFVPLMRLTMLKQAGTTFIHVRLYLLASHTLEYTNPNRSLRMNLYHCLPNVDSLYQGYQ